MHVELVIFVCLWVQHANYGGELPVKSCCCSVTLICSFIVAQFGWCFLWTPPSRLSACPAPRIQQNYWVCLVAPICYTALASYRFATAVPMCICRSCMFLFAFFAALHDMWQIFSYRSVAEKYRCIWVRLGTYVSVAEAYRYITMHTHAYGCRWLRNGCICRLYLYTYI